MPITPDWIKIYVSVLRDNALAYTTACTTVSGTTNYSHSVNGSKLQ